MAVAACVWLMCASPDWSAEPQAWQVASVPAAGKAARLDSNTSEVSTKRGAVKGDRLAVLRPAEARPQQQQPTARVEPPGQMTPRPVEARAKVALGVAAEKAAPAPERKVVASLSPADTKIAPDNKPAEKPQAAKAPPAKPVPEKAAKAPPDKPAGPDKPVVAEKPSAAKIFEKLFRKEKEDAPEGALAYAPTDGGVATDAQSIKLGMTPPFDRYTAVYDISAHTVYMPDGTTLEAHSGLGNRFDDPRFVSEKMRGATPPHVYNLKPREAIFHGVWAIRLIPVGGENAIFGRTGLLAHTYMLGARGDSFGCVSFKNYDAFLRAYRDGKVKRLVVLASIE